MALSFAPPFFILFGCTIYFLHTSQSAACLRALILIYVHESSKALGYKVLFVDKIFAAFVISNFFLEANVLTVGNMLSWLCYINICFFLSTPYNRVIQIVGLQLVMMLISCGFFLEGNVLNPLMNILFLPAFVILFVGLVLGFLFTMIIPASESVSIVIIDFLECFFMMLQDIYYTWGHVFDFKLKASEWSILLPTAVLLVASLMVFHLEKASTLNNKTVNTVL